MTRRTDPRETRTPVPTGELPAFDPVPRRAKRHDGWTVRGQRGFIEALADTGSVAAAAKAVNMSTEGAYMLRRAARAESFRAAWEAALDLGVQRIEDVAMDRALNGVESPVYSYGKLIGTRTVFNDRLLMFILRNRAPDRFSAGRPKRLSALDYATVARLKKEWMTQWTHERELIEREQNESEEEHQASIRMIRDRIEAMQVERQATLSPRARAAWEEYQRLLQEDEAQRAADGEEEASDAAAALPPPEEDERDEPEPEESPTGPRIWQL